MFFRDQFVDGKYVGDHLFGPVLAGEHAWRRIRRRRPSMTTMIVRVDVEAVLREVVGKTVIARSVFGKAMVDLHDSASRFGSLFRKKVQYRAGRRSKRASFLEWHPWPILPGGER
jgi:hypothetical protein